MRSLEDRLCLLVQQVAQTGRAVRSYYKLESFIQRIRNSIFDFPVHLGHLREAIKQLSALMGCLVYVVIDPQNSFEMEAQIFDRWPHLDA